MQTGSIYLFISHLIPASSYRPTLVIVLLLMVVFQDSEAQINQHHPATISRAGSGSHSIGGFDAVYANPASLLQREPTNEFTINFLQVGAAFGGQLVNTNVYNRYLTTGRVLDAPLQAEMLGQWFPKGSRHREYASFQADITTLGLAYQFGSQSVAVGHKVRSFGRLGVTKGVFEAAFGGLDDDLFGEPARLDLNAEWLTVSEFSAAYAAQLYGTAHDPLFGLPMRIRGGIAPKLLITYNAFEFDTKSTLKVQGDSLVIHRFNYEINTHGNLGNGLRSYSQDRRGPNGSDVSISDYTNNSFEDIDAVAGYGFGISMGAIAELSLPAYSFGHSFFGEGPRNLSLGFALTDMGRAVVNREPGRINHTDVLQWEGLTIDNDWIAEEYEGNIDDYLDFVVSDSLGRNTYLAYDISNKNFSMALPAHASISAVLSSLKANVSVDLHKGFNNVGLNSKRIKASAGVEYHLLSWLPLRTGLSAGGKYGIILGIGTGLNGRNYRFDIGTSVSPASRRRGAWAAVSFGSSISF